MISTRESFVKRFNEETAQAIEAAADEHKNGVHDRAGSDPFRWAIAICLGYECMSKESYRNYHGITPPWDDLKAWIKTDGDLVNHDGEFDYIAAFIGVYSEFVPEKKEDGN